MNVRTILATLLAVLSLASSESAECAWVLWDENQVAGVPVDPWASWATVQEFSGRVECERYASSWRTRLLTEKQPARADGEWVELLSTEGSVRTRWRYTCVPDTVDPRAAKR